MALQMGTSLAYDTDALVQIVANLKRPQTFLLDKFFPQLVLADTEFVSFDIDVGKRRIAPFGSPTVESKVVEQRRIATLTVKPAYIKDKRAPDLRRPVRRMIGERIGGEMTGGEREAANLAFEMQDQIDMLTRRMEWMAAQVLQAGSLTISGEGQPDTFLDFSRDPSLTITLSGAAQWTQANVTAMTASPTSNIEAWQRMILKKSGARVTDIIFTTTSWAGFITDPLLKNAIYYPKLGDYANTIDVGPKIEHGAVYKGRWGQYDLWIYNDWFVQSDPNAAQLDLETPMITDGTVILSGPDMMGTRVFGMIIDPDFNYAVIPFAPKVWTNKDPAQRYLMMQSAPLILPARANACMSANVATAVYM